MLNLRISIYKNIKATTPDIVSLRAFERYTPFMPIIFGTIYRRGIRIPPYLSIYNNEDILGLLMDWK